MGLGIARTPPGQRKLGGVVDACAPTTLPQNPEPPVFRDHMEVSTVSPFESESPLTTETVTLVLESVKV